MCIRDSINTITEDICEVIGKQTEQICERMLWEQTIIVENTFVINNDNHKEMINIKKRAK